MTLDIIIIHCIIFKFIKKNYLSSVMKYLAPQNSLSIKNYSMLYSGTGRAKTKITTKLKWDYIIQFVCSHGFDSVNSLDWLKNGRTVGRIRRLG